MSLGGGRYYSSLNPTDSIGVALQTARDAGIVPVVSAGNEGYSDSLAWSAAYSNVVSMYAVYDADLGSIGYGICSDTTAADKVACFSNSALFLTLLAPVWHRAPLLLLQISRRLARRKRRRMWLAQPPSWQPPIRMKTERHI